MLTIITWKTVDMEAKVRKKKKKEKKKVNSWTHAHKTFIQRRIFIHRNSGLCQPWSSM